MDWWKLIVTWSLIFAGLLSDTVQADSSAIEIVNPLTSWSNFGDCSVSCGKGTKKRVVKCQPKGNERNQNCPPGTESYTEKVPCTRPSCPGKIQLWEISTNIPTQKTNVAPTLLHRRFRIEKQKNAQNPNLFLIWWSRHALTNYEPP